MTKRTIVLGIVSIICANSLYASSFSSWWQQKNWHPVATVEGGATLTTTVKNSQNFPIQDPITDQFYHYSADSSAGTLGLYGLFLGAEWNLRSPWLLQAGLDYTLNSPFLTQGTLTQGADITSQDTFTYQYRVHTQSLWAEGKLLYTLCTRYHPYFLLGLGTSFNRAYHYSTNVPPDITFTRLYQDNTSTSFSYGVGIGIDTDINSHLRIGLGYRFADLGKIALGKATIDTSSVSGTLTQSHLYVNQITGQLTFVI